MMSGESQKTRLSLAGSYAIHNNYVGKLLDYNSIFLRNSWGYRRKERNT